MTKKDGHKFLGMTTVGEKGQVVIPAEARIALKLEKGDKLIVMSPHGNALVLVKASNLESFASELMSHIETLKGLPGEKPRTKKK